MSEAATTVRGVRLIVARCEVVYTGRLNAVLPVSTRLLMLKSDGSVLVHADSGGYKPLNWMTPPTVIEEDGNRIVVRKRAGPDRGPAGDPRPGSAQRRRPRDGRGGGAREGRRREPPPGRARRAAGVLEEELTLVRREWPTDIGPVDLMCRDAEGGWVAVEIKRIGTIEAVEQLSRYLEYIRVDPARAECRGILAAQSIKPQAVKLAELRGLGCVEVDLELLRGDREPELTLFG